MKHFYFTYGIRLFVCGTLLALAACGSDVKETLGLGKEAPDEFVVVSRPPLTLPPDFELRPPASPSDNPAASGTETEARKALLGAAASTDDHSLTELHGLQPDTAVTPVQQNNAPTGATASFLSKAGADQANPDIRQMLSSDAKTVKDNSDAPTLYDQVISKQQADSVVDPQKEAARIHDDQAAGKPVTEGDTPVAAPQNSSVIGHIF